MAEVDERVSPRTEAGREFHDELHAPGGAYEQVTGNARCGTLGCGSLGYIAAIEAEAIALDRAELAAAVRAEMSEERHRLVKRASGEVVCECGGYSGPAAGAGPATAWREHLIAAVLALIEGEKGADHAD